VTLDAVADSGFDRRSGEIHRVDQERVAIVSANLRHGDLGAADEGAAIVAENPLRPAPRARGRAGRGAGGFDARCCSRSRSAVFLVYLVMASQFESLLHPFVILFTIPLALVGAVLGLKLSGTSISVVVFIGLILLVGIVVKNAIILIDKVNQLREQACPSAMLIEGARSRLRPIIMTTLTTLLGFLPMALGHGEGAEIACSRWRSP
jgi:HAE1 family hydrophobic/amphiphilic exporter-1